MINSTIDTSRRRPAAPLGVVLLRQREVCQKTGLSRTKLDCLEATGQFPKRIQLPGRAVAWRSGEVDQWIEDRSANRVDIRDRRDKKRRKNKRD